MAGQNSKHCAENYCRIVAFRSAKVAFFRGAKDDRNSPSVPNPAEPEPNRGQDSGFRKKSGNQRTFYGLRKIS